MRHGGRTNFSNLGTLLEVTQGDVGPKVAIHVQQDRVGARNRIKQFRHAIVWLNLNRIWIELQAQALLHDFARKLLPIKIGVSRKVRVVVTHCTIHFAEQRHRYDRSNRTLQSFGDIGNLFAQGSRRSRLAMGARKHGYASVGQC